MIIFHPMYIFTINHLYDVKSFLPLCLFFLGFDDCITIFAYAQSLVTYKVAPGQVTVFQVGFVVDICSRIGETKATHINVNPGSINPKRLFNWGCTISVAIYHHLSLFGGTTTINQPGFFNPGLTLLISS